MQLVRIEAHWGTVTPATHCDHRSGWARCHRCAQRHMQHKRPVQHKYRPTSHTTKQPKVCHARHFSQHNPGLLRIKHAWQPSMPTLAYMSCAHVSTTPTPKIDTTGQPIPHLTPQGNHPRVVACQASIIRGSKPAGAHSMVLEERTSWTGLISSRVWVQKATHTLLRSPAAVPPNRRQ